MYAGNNTAPGSNGAKWDSVADSTTGTTPGARAVEAHAGMTREDYAGMSRPQWRALKDQWRDGINSYYRVTATGQQKRLSAKALAYLHDVANHMGNGGKYARGEYAFAASRTANRLNLGGIEQTRINWVSDARREAIRHGFIEEVKRGTGGNAHKSKGSVVAMSFRFLGLIGSPVEPVAVVDRAPGGRAQGSTNANRRSATNANDIRGTNANNMTFIATGANTGEQIQGDTASGSDGDPLAGYSVEELQLLGVW